MKMGAIGALALACALALGCGSTTMEAVYDDADADAPDADEALTDPQVAGVTAAVNAGEVRAGGLAAARASDSAVRAFAERMVAEHTETGARQAELLAGLGITPEASATSRRVTDDADATYARLAGESGPAFDRAYMLAQVKMHADALELIDARLIPTTKEPSLRSFLAGVRGDVARHLDEARTIATALDMM